MNAITSEPSPSMHSNLAERRQAMIERCTHEAQQVGRTLLFGMTTSLVLQSVPLPEDCDLDASKLHIVSSMKTRRVRAHASTLCSHIWKLAPQANKVRINQHVLAMDLFHVWAQLASHISLRSLVILGDAIITAIRRQPVLAQNRDGSSIYRDFVVSLEHMPKFSGRLSCVRALMLMSPGADSPKESEKRLSLQSHGIPEASVNYVVPNIMFASRAPITVDLAWPHYKVAVEYDGDQHRTDKMQWRRDQEKRGKLQGRGWLVFVATAASLADDYTKAEFAFRVGRALALRGARFTFHLKALSLEQLAPLSRTIDWRGLEARK
ncbi:hypothetical protein [Bifidobacterium cebidarum]|uniref:DUF559 domain-containing protein n=1 Tax=Bifidobacterium cebidarum TaxID=2650773 RepID=A0A6I1G931_9BIFI|nr:hypothetical protein [Bifidobacterium cebidarum]KAB7788214.1 hypothetical protein F7D08_1251 [Bifidobacterium cebidarum]